MDLSRHLSYFLVVAEELHFGRAADLLGITQPPLSQSIQRLERQLGVRLFDRSHRQISLTAAGTLLVNEARSMLAAEERVRAVMRLARDGALGTLRAGVPPETSAIALQTLLHRLTDSAPGLEVDLHELTTAEQLRGLMEARLDVGLVQHPIDVPDLVIGAPVTTPLGVVVPRISPLARLAEVRRRTSPATISYLLPAPQPRHGTTTFSPHVSATDSRPHGYVTRGTPISCSG